MCESVKRRAEVQETRVEELNWGSFGALCGLVCYVSTFTFVHCASGFGLQLVLNEIFFFFNGCLDSFMLSLSHSLMSCLWSLALIGCDKAQMVILSCHVIFVVLLVYIYNILTIGFGTLCFMHLVSGCNLNIFLANFFF